MTSADPEMLWAPANPEATQAAQFRKHIAKTHNVKLDTYEDLWNWTCKNRGDFWSEVWDWEGVIGDKGSGPVSVRIGASFCSRQSSIANYRRTES